jgi:glycogen operon protein
VTSFAELAMGEGMPAPLGATLVAGGVSFAVVAPNAGAVYVCLFDGNDRETARFRLPTRHGDIHCGFLSGASAGCRYGLRAEGPWAPEAGHRYDAAKLLVDPYATRLDRPFAWNPSLAVRGAESAHLVPKAIVETQAPAVSPSAPRPLGFVYELPVRAYTIRHPDVPDKLRGTVAALAEPCIVEHLARLGVDTVELMPLWAWIDERHLPALGLANAWGYNPVSLLAPDPRLAPGGMAEIRATVAKLHEAGLRVVLDVVVNHSGESDTHGATLSLRGLDNALYYARGTDGTLVNDTGCGNTLALEHAPVVRLAMDALRHWAAAGFDGFRFDLAAVLGRTGQGFDPQSPLLAAIAQDPVLSRLSLIAEPWAAVPGSYRLGGFPHPWHEWNDRYRDRARRFWRGDAHAMGDFATAICGSSDVFGGSHRRPSASINLLAAHDGFTLSDVVHYAEKRNEANGESNRDGHSGEVSWISASPHADVRAMLATLMLSRGTPMLTAGDELGRTQGGNNNAYAQDNAVTWIDWQGAETGLIAFTARLAALRRQLEPVTVDAFLEGRDIDGSGFADAVWLDCAGCPVSAGQWADPAFSTIGLVLASGQRAALWFNRAGHGVACTLPAPQAGHAWRVVLDSADDDRSGVVSGGIVDVAPRSVLVAIEEASGPDKSASGKQLAGATDRQVAALAEAAGIRPDWYEVDGTYHRVGPETQRALLAAMRLPAATAADVRASLAALRHMRELRPLPLNTATHEDGGRLDIVLPEASGQRRIALRLRHDSGDERVLEFAPGDLAPVAALAHDGVRLQRYSVRLPALERGFYSARLDACPDVEGRLIVHPAGCFMPDELSGGRRRFGLAAHLYALRDERDAGIGDLGTLSRFAAATKNIGGITAGINPLHHMFPTDRERASPYQPSDRCFIDPLYADLDGIVAELGGEGARAAMSADAAEIERLRAGRYVDYTRVWALKENVLRAVFADCARRPLPALDAFIASGGERLRRHALFESLARRAGTVDRSRWPAELAAPDAVTLDRLANEHRDEMRFRAFLQWCLERQLDVAHRSGPALGLYRDLALGVAQDGGEVWAEPDLFAGAVSLGAPPDPFAAAGQIWNLPPFIPHALQQRHFQPYADILSASMRSAGALRIDHILGIARQFWVPAGADGSAGAYVAFPMEELIALTALLSAEARCCVIGEDLGTVPEGFRERLAAAGILSYRVLWLEREHGGAFIPPGRYPRLSVACLSTHDLPPFLGWTASADAGERCALEKAIAASAIERGSTDADLMVAAHALTAEAQSSIMLVQADDLAAETEPLNVPGTDREHPNWRRRIALAVDEIAAGDLAKRVLAAVAASRERG